MEHLLLIAFYFHWMVIHQRKRQTWCVWGIFLNVLFLYLFDRLILLCFQWLLQSKALGLHLIFIVWIAQIRLFSPYLLLLDILCLFRIQLLVYILVGLYCVKLFLNCVEPWDGCSNPASLIALRSSSLSRKSLNVVPWVPT